MCWAEFKTIGHSLKNLGTSQKTFAPPGVPSSLRACFKACCADRQDGRAFQIEVGVRKGSCQGTDLYKGSQPFSYENNFKWKRGVAPENWKNDFRKTNGRVQKRLLIHVRSMRMNATQAISIMTWLRTRPIWEKLFTSIFIDATMEWRRVAVEVPTRWQFHVLAWRRKGSAPQSQMCLC